MSVQADTSQKRMPLPANLEAPLNMEFIEVTLEVFQPGCGVVKWPSGQVAREAGGSEVAVSKDLKAASQGVCAPLLIHPPDRARLKLLKPSNKPADEKRTARGDVRHREGGRWAKHSNHSRVHHL